MARLNAQQRKSLPLSAFAVPSKAPGPGSYPEPDRGHAIAAKGRAAQFGSPAVQARVAAKAAPILGKKPKVRAKKKRKVRPVAGM